MFSSFTEKICTKCQSAYKVLSEYTDKDNELCLSCMEKKQDAPLSVTIKSEALDITNLESGKGSKQYRPQILKNYIGQEQAKERIKDYLKGCKDFNETFPHTFLTAPAGHGKSLLANIIANMIDKKLVKCTGGELKTEQHFVDKIVECDGGIIFIDEANKINSKVGFFMLPVIELFEINNKKLKPFIVIFATTHVGDIAKNLDALIQRCDLRLDLNHYNHEELITIMKQYKEKQYPKEKVSEEIYLEVAENCRFTPRIARSLLKEYIYNRDWSKTKFNNKIVSHGLTQTDIKMLKYLNQFENGLGKNTIANYLKIKSQTFEFEIEPFLVHKKLMIVDNRRKITHQGKDLLKCLK